MRGRYTKIVLLVCVALVAVLQACTPARELAYISDAERDSAKQIVASYANSIHPGDQLYIYVYSQTPESVIPFNQETHVLAAEMSHINLMEGGNGEKPMSDTYSRRATRQVSGYWVDDSGMIDFPVLGRLQVAGLTHDSLQNLIQRRLMEGDYLYDPVVTVSSMNFRVSVIGEVACPRELHVTGDRLTLLEAIAMCGDLTIYGQRENVVVVREKNGEAVPLVVDLTKKTLFDSECYYLQHNDIVYVEPNKQKKKMATYDPSLRQDIISYVNLGTAIGRLTYVTYRRYVLDRRGIFD